MGVPPPTDALPLFSFIQLVHEVPGYKQVVSVVALDLLITNFGTEFLIYSINGSSIHMTQ